MRNWFLFLALTIHLAHAHVPAFHHDDASAIATFTHSIETSQVLYTTSNLTVHFEPVTDTTASILLNENVAITHSYMCQHECTNHTIRYNGVVDMKEELEPFTQSVSKKQVKFQVQKLEGIHVFLGSRCETLAEHSTSRVGRWHG